MVIQTRTGEENCELGLEMMIKTKAVEKKKKFKKKN